MVIETTIDGKKYCLEPSKVSEIFGPHIEPGIHLEDELVLQPNIFKVIGRRWGRLDRFPWHLTIIVEKMDHSPLDFNLGWKLWENYILDDLPHRKNCN